jgi:LysM repeat protein
MADQRTRTRRSPARFLAPLALIAVIVAFLAIVTSSGNNGGGGTDTTGNSATTATSASKTTTSKTSSTTTAAKKKAAGGKTVYVVQVGDTLGAIATKTGVPLETIQSLNPDVDPHAMVAGQKIKLK